MKRKIISMLLIIVMVISMLPMTLIATDATSRVSEGGYYWLDLFEDSSYKWIKEIGMGAYDPDIFDNLEGIGSNNAKAELRKMLDFNNYGILDEDLNESVGGDYIYIGWNTTSDPTEAITGVQARVFEDIDESEGPVRSYTASGVTWYLANSGCHEWAPKLNKDQSEDGYLDLNDGAGGDYVYLYVTKDPNYGPPLYNIGYTYSPIGSNTSSFIQAVCDNIGKEVDFNSGIDDASIYLHTFTNFKAVEIARLKKLTETANAFLSVQSPSSKYLWSDDIRTLCNDMVSRLATWNASKIVSKSDKFATGDLIEPGYIEAFNNSLEAKLNDIFALIHFNDTTNGGNKNTTKEYPLGKNPTVKTLVQVDLSEMVATNEGYEFLGWNTDKNATTGQKTGIVSAAPGTTFYAIYKKESTVNFHYLNEDATAAQSSVSTVSYNRQDATYNIPSVPTTITKNDKTYTLKGWHTNEKAVDPSHTNTTGTLVEPLYSDLYAIYTYPVTISFDTRGGSPVDPITSDLYLSASGKTIWPEFDLGTVTFTPPTGKKFTGWVDNKNSYNASYSSDVVFSRKEDKTFYACYVNAHEHDEILYTALTQEMIDEKTLTSGNYYLTESFTGSELIIPDGINVNLCLNGFTLDLGEGFINNSGSLSICDCSPQKTGSILGSSNARGVIYNIGTLNISSGNVDGKYGIINTEIGVANISGGTITGSQYGIDNENSGKVNVSGGTIKGVYYGISNADKGVVSVVDGNISGKYGITNSTGSTLNVSGGTMLGTTYYGIFNAGNLSLSGNPNISGGSAALCVNANKNKIDASEYNGEQLSVSIMVNTVQEGMVIVQNSTVDKFNLINIPNYTLAQGNGSNASHLIYRHIHNWDTNWTNDENAHWHECLVEGCDETNGNDTHHSTGDNKATYLKKATCDACRIEYGEVVPDEISPMGMITIGTNRWLSFLNFVTFDLFFKETQSVSIDADDNETGVARVEYYITDSELSVDEVKALTNWNEYTGKFHIEPENKYIIYAKITDNAGNVIYINTDGFVIDSIAPAVSGIENGETYCNPVEVTVSDDNLKNVTVNGTEVTLTNGKFTVNPADGVQKIEAHDKAGNVTTITITVNDGHSYVYDDSTEDTIVEKCRYCDFFASAQIKAPIGEIIYDGNEHRATVVYTGTLSCGTNLSISYGDAKFIVHAGDYIASIKFGGKTASVKYAINKVKVEKPVADSTVFTYNDAEQVYNIAASDLYTVTGNTRTNAGEQNVTVSLKNNTNYEWADGTTDDLTFKFNIEKAEVTAPTINSKVYNGNTQIADVANTNYYIVSTNDGGIDVGLYDVTVSLKDSDNYKWADSNEVAITLKFTISPKALKQSDFYIPVTEYKYTGSETRPAVVPALGTFWYTGDFRTEYRNNINVGTAKIIITGVGNYSGVVEYSFEIVKAEQNAPSGFIVLDESYALDADGQINGVNSTMEYRKDGEAQYTEIHSNVLPNLTPGKYYIRYKETANYNPSGDTEIVIKAGEKRSSLIKITAQLDKVYDGNSVSLVDEYVYYGDGEVSIKWYSDVSGERREEISAPVNAGTYWVGITATETDRYNPANSYKQFTVAKAVKDPTEQNIQGITNGYAEDKSGVISGVSPEMEYRKEGETTYTPVTGNEITDLENGTYYIRYAADENHDASQEIKVVIQAPDCECNCHSENPFMKFINKVFYAICNFFGVNRHCCCDATHYDSYLWKPVTDLFKNSVK